MKVLNHTYICSVLLAAATLSFTACHSDEKEKEEKQEAQRQQQDIEVPPVQVVTLTKGKLSSNLQVPGELAPFQQVNLYAKINSYVKQYLADVGSEVRKGQLLIQLEAPEINSQLNSAKARIRQQEALYLASKANYDRLYNTSKTPGTIAQNDIDQAEARKKADYANLEAAKASYQEIASNLTYLQIRAPFDGVVSERNASMGAYVGPAGQGSALPLMVIQQQKKLRLIISVPEINTGGLSNQGEVDFTVRALPNQNFKARIKRMAGSLDARLRSERLEMDVENNSKKLLPGMYAEVSVPLKTKDSTFVVPGSAVVQSTERVFVIRIDANRRAQWIDVQKGLQGKEGIEIYSKELNAGDKLVKTATDEIRDGQPVKETAAEEKKD
ncbi:efflux RND transporter periplasmic adaptor subunit [Mucilaginibacter sp. Bleaf8]|uniref:efflux RND transporter periplasmic adaptor subunit n=1 Tax=Mucilaginibacter sp. Bleaf8 TaxID=2834430 RepID=UPI001BD130C3|nr:efflux RND transporter periplasmic adaptor subunit [Mucilaginibacter sp. Bleaf8]MBS7563458.1 efflux RND transporter periplasmic adaptor subunit [Mucilaginibacter sp. Bleaf8]